MTSASCPKTHPPIELLHHSFTSPVLMLPLLLRETDDLGITMKDSHHPDRSWGGHRIYDIEARVKHHPSFHP